MQSLLIMGMPRGGTTVAIDLFKGVPLLELMNELPISYLERAIYDGKIVVWKSPHACLEGDYIHFKLPEVFQTYVIRDGRQNLASYKHYIELNGVDPSFAPYQGAKGFGLLWNRFIEKALTVGNYFLLEELVGNNGSQIVETLIDIVGVNSEQRVDVIEFWRKYIYLKQQPYPRAASKLETPPWSEILTDREISWIDVSLLRELGYE